VDARTGDLLWQTFTAPDIGRGANDSWAGASIWVGVIAVARLALSQLCIGPCHALEAPHRACTRRFWLTNT
jgi:hypothetical protein